MDTIKKLLSFLSTHLHLKHYLFIVLGLCAVLFFVLAIFLDWQGVFVNLGTTSLGILCTVAFVDWILRKHKKSELEILTDHIRLNIRDFAGGIIYAFQAAFGINFRASYLLSYGIYGEAAIVGAEKDVIPAISQKIEQLKEDELKLLVARLHNLRAEGDRMIFLYGRWLEPEVVSNITIVQDKIQNVSEPLVIDACQELLNAAVDLLKINIDTYFYGKYFSKTATRFKR